MRSAGAKSNWPRRAGTVSIFISSRGQRAGTHCEASRHNGHHRDPGTAVTAVPSSGTWPWTAPVPKTRLLRWLRHDDAHVPTSVTHSSRKCDFTAALPATRADAHADRRCRRAVVQPRSCDRLSRPNTRRTSRRPVLDRAPCAPSSRPPRRSGPRSVSPATAESAARRRIRAISGA